MAGPRYIADAPDALRSAPLESLTAVYHRPSGMTHLLAPPAPQILEALASWAGTPEDVLERIASSFEIEAEDPVAAMAARLEELEAAGLVRRL
jgi:PqqD family protein of HPr-rel-A system